MVKILVQGGPQPEQLGLTANRFESVAGDCQAG